MGDTIIKDAVAVATAIVALATLAVLVSSKAKTSDVIKAASTGFADDLKAAVAPLG